MLYLLHRPAYRHGQSEARLWHVSSGEALGWQAPRPAFVPLASERGALLPPLARALEGSPDRLLRRPRAKSWLRRDGCNIAHDVTTALEKR